MLINSFAKLSLLRALSRYWYDWLTPEEVAHLGNLNRSWVYKLATELEEGGVLRRWDSRLGLELESRLALAYKYAFDLERLQALPPSIVTAVTGLLDDALHRQRSKLEFAILIGSAARNRLTPASDVDILLVGKEPGALPASLADRVNVVALDTRRFAADLAEGDDFIGSGLRYGLVIHGIEFFGAHARRPLPEVSSQVLARRREHIEKLIERIPVELHDESLELVRTDLRALGIGVARVALLLAGQYPGSAPELPYEVKRLWGQQAAGIISRSLAQGDGSEAPLLLDRYEELVSLHRAIQGAAGDIEKLRPLVSGTERRIMPAAEHALKLMGWMVRRDHVRDAPISPQVDLVGSRTSGETLAVKIKSHRVAPRPERLRAWAEQVANVPATERWLVLNAPSAIRPLWRDETFPAELSQIAQHAGVQMLSPLALFRMAAESRLNAGLRSGGMTFPRESPEWNVAENPTPG